MITLYTVAYNEEFFLPHMIKHYRERFPGCQIVLYDNMSTDRTVEIAREYGCKIIPFDTNGLLIEERLTYIRNNCWKNAPTDWVLVCDVDELLDISESQLKEEEGRGVSIIKAEGYDMVDMVGKVDIPGMHYGARDIGHDKSHLFNKK